MDNPNDTHPSEYTHEKFVDDVILNWEIFDIDDFLGRLIDDSYEKLFLDDMPIEISEIDGCIGYEELVKQCLQQLGKSNKKKVVVIKVGEMFDVILINEITKILQENFKDKKFILLVDDYRKLNLDFPLIESMRMSASFIMERTRW